MVYITYYQFQGYSNVVLESNTQVEYESILLVELNPILWYFYIICVLAAVAESIGRNNIQK